MQRHDGGIAAAEKATLRMLLDEAAVLEHQFLCQYLYAAFSLKKSPSTDGSCSDAEFEHVRRWASMLYRIARQEMEHLSVVNSILTATGLEPCLWRFGFPAQSAWLTGAARAPDGAPTPCDLPFVLSRFDLTTATRFMCMESPLLADVPAAYQPLIQSSCFVDASGECPCAPPTDAAHVPRFEHARGDAEALLGGIEIGTVQKLYQAIEAELDRLAAAHGEAWLFDGHRSGQSEIPSEYDIYLFPICDLRSAKAGIRMVKEQGEGIEAAAGYTAHFEHFADIVTDYRALLAANPEFDPAMPLPLDPSAGSYPNPTAVQAAQIFDRGYYLLLQMLTSYYAYYRKDAWKQKPYLAAAMEQAAFAPMMTMFIRSLAEVMAMIPTGRGDERTGGTFFLAVSQLRTLQAPELPIYSDINHYIEGVEGLVAALANLAAGDVPPEAKPKLAFIVQTMTRVGLKLGHVYQQGIYPKFDPADPDNTCAHDTTCD